MEPTLFVSQSRVMGPDLFTTLSQLMRSDCKIIPTVSPLLALKPFFFDKDLSRSGIFMGVWFT